MILRLKRQARDSESCFCCLCFGVMSLGQEGIWQKRMLLLNATPSGPNIIFNDMFALCPAVTYSDAICLLLLHYTTLYCTIYFSSNQHIGRLRQEIIHKTLDQTGFQVRIQDCSMRLKVFV